MSLRVRSSLAATVLIALVLLPSAVPAPTAVEYLVGPVGLARGQMAEMQCQNNFGPRAVHVRLAFFDLDGNGLVGGEKPLTLGPGETASLALSVDELFPDLPDGERVGVVGRLQVVGAPGFIEQQPLLPGASLQVFDVATGRSGLLGGFARLR